MNPTHNEQDDPEYKFGSYKPDFSLLFPRNWSLQNRFAFAVTLVITGMILVVLADFLGVFFAKDAYGMWNHEEAIRTASTLRLLGVMLFATGLLERVLLCWEKIALSRKS